jgi:hypothetical protein
MKLLRAFQISTLLAIGLGVACVASTPVFAGDRTTAPGVYDASIVYIPGISVPGGLPDCVDQFAQQTYVGKLTVAKAGSGYIVRFVGENADDASLNLRASAEFNSSWTGFVLGALGGRDDAIVGIDAANLVRGRITGRVQGDNGKFGVVIALVGAGGTIESCRFVGPGAR